MASELRFAVRCGSRQKPSAKARSRSAVTHCSRCSPHSSLRRSRYCSGSLNEETTYIPSIEIPRLNGVSPVLHDEPVDLPTKNTSERLFRLHFSYFSFKMIFFFPIFLNMRRNECGYFMVGLDSANSIAGQTKEQKLSWKNRRQIPESNSRQSINSLVRVTLNSLTIYAMCLYRNALSIFSARLKIEKRDRICCLSTHD